MSDGYAAWRTVESATHLGCWAHATRAFVDAGEGQKKPSERIAQALEYIKVLYQVEALAKRDLPDGQTRHDYIYELRQKHSVPVLDAFKTWLDMQVPVALPKSLLGKAIGYARNQWPYLSRYVEDGARPSTTMSLNATSVPSAQGETLGCSAIRWPAPRPVR